MTYIQVKVPDGTDISGYDAKLGLPDDGDMVLHDDGRIRISGDSFEPWIILTPKWKPPEWLKPGFVFIAGNFEWYWTSESPVKKPNGEYWCSPIANVIRLSNTNFQGPDVEPKDSLIEIKG